MSLYVYAPEGTVADGPRRLPRNWRHVSGLDGLSDEELASLGWFPAPGDAPDYDPRWQTISGPVTVQEGEGWASQWTVTDRPVEDLRTQRAREIDALRDEMIARGAPIDLGGGVAFTVQTRDERDFVNVLGLATLAQGGLIEGEEFRDADDVTHELSAAQLIALGAQVAAWRSSHYKAAWAHKGVIAALETAEAVATHDITSGWPE